MFEHILVGVDERGGRDAISLARKLVAADGKLVLAHVHSGDGRVHGGDGYGHGQLAHEHALELLSRARDEAGVEAALCDREAASVGRGLHELAELEGADLLVIGSCRRGPVGRVLVGDDTRAALNGASCALAVAPTGYAPTPPAIRNVGLAYDGSAESVCALELARGLAHELGANLSALEVVASTPRFGPGPLPLADRIDPLVAEARERVAALGGLEAHAEYGDPAEELARFSASLDLLVVGSRGYGPLGRLVHGSISRQLVRVTRCPLLVLPRAVAVSATPGTAGERAVGAPAGA
jgi:nucleotide-binding universal stress UspA family protein